MLFYALFFLYTKSVFTNSELDTFLKYHEQTITYAVENQNISKPCLNQLRTYLKELQERQIWALQMFDANAKFPSGILRKALCDPGDFDECLNIENKYIHGKYCLSAQKPKKNQKKTVQFNADYRFDTNLHFGTCLPQKCTLHDASLVYPNLVFLEQNCATKASDSKIPFGTVSTIIFLITFVGICVLATSYNVYLFYKKPLKISSISTIFSYLTNGRKLLSSATNSKQFSCLDGIRVITMIWIFHTHTNIFRSRAVSTDLFKIIQLIKNPINMYVLEGSLSVDTFFLVGGFCLAFSFFKSDHSGYEFNFLQYCVHRYFRLTPVLAVCILVHAHLVTFLGSGPFWTTQYYSMVTACRDNWWAALLYIQNFTNSKNLCLPHSWYLSIDMQLFILSPVALFLLKKHFKLGIHTLIILILINIPLTFLFAYKSKLRAFLLQNSVDRSELFFDYYYNTFARYPPYVIGLILGYYLHLITSGQKKLEIKLNLQLLIWFLAVSFAFFCIYCGGFILNTYNQVLHAAYLAFIRIMWSLSIAVIILLCCVGYGGPINKFLSCSTFHILSKLNYSTYLVHYGLLSYLTVYDRTPYNFDRFHLIFEVCGQYIFTTFLALFLYLTFEMPMVSIEKYLFHKVSSTTPK